MDAPVKPQRIGNYRRRRINQAKKLVAFSLLMLFVVGVIVAVVAIAGRNRKIDPLANSASTLSVLSVPASAVPSQQSSSLSSTPVSSSSASASSSKVSQAASQKSVASKPNQQTKIPAEAAKAVVPKSDPVDESYLDDAVFIGDSITLGLGNYQLVDMDNVVADIGINLDKIMTEKYIHTSSGDVTVLDAVKQKKPKKIYIMLGSNGIAWTKPSVLAGRYETFLNALMKQNPSAVIYIESIPPVTLEKTKKDARYNNQTINEYNLLLLKLAAKKGVYYLDTHSALVDDSGALPTAIAEKDGMHFKMSAYKSVYAYYLSHSVDPKANEEPAKTTS